MAHLMGTSTLYGAQKFYVLHLQLHCTIRKLTSTAAGKNKNTANCYNTLRARPTTPLIYNTLRAQTLIATH